MPVSTVYSMRQIHNALQPQFQVKVLHASKITWQETAQFSSAATFLPQDDGHGTQAGQGGPWGAGPVRQAPGTNGAAQLRCGGVYQDGGHEVPDRHEGGGQALGRCKIWLLSPALFFLFIFEPVACRPITSFFLIYFFLVLFFFFLFLFFFFSCGS